MYFLAVGTFNLSHFFISYCIKLKKLAPDCKKKTLNVFNTENT